MAMAMAMAMPMSIRAFFIRILFLCNLFARLASLNFTYNGFNNTTDVLHLDGAATRIEDGALQLTNDSQNVTGHVFYKTPIPMSISPNRLSASFSTHFAFQIIPSSTSNRGGYGLAFTLSPFSAFPDSAAGQFMGVFNPYNDGNSSNHVFMVEFDTVEGHGEKSESDGNHVGININGMNSTASSSVEYANERNNRNAEDFNLEKAGPIQAWIEYDGVNKIVNVTVCPLNIKKPGKPLITEGIDLSLILKENMYAGFSAATGSTTSSHYILGWSFRLNGTADPLSPHLLPTLPNKKPLSSNASKLKTPLIATFSAILTLLVLALISALY